jgi:hypothetical protein
MTASRKRAAAASGILLAAAIAMPRPAAADPIALTVNSGPTIPQKLNRPCVIGDPSCHNPSSFGYTLLRPQDKADTVSSPTYTVDQIRTLVGDTFFVGVDVNQARGHDDGRYYLQSFTMAVNGTLMYTTTSPSVITPINPGNGYSDASIVGFDLRPAGKRERGVHDEVQRRHRRTRTVLPARCRSVRGGHSGARLADAPGHRPARRCCMETAPSARLMLAAQDRRPSCAARTILAIAARGRKRGAPAVSLFDRPGMTTVFPAIIPS